MTGNVTWNRKQTKGKISGVQGPQSNCRCIPFMIASFKTPEPNDRLRGLQGHVPSRPRHPKMADKLNGHTGKTCSLNGHFINAVMLDMSRGACTTHKAVSAKHLNRLHNVSCRHPHGGGRKSNRQHPLLSRVGHGHGLAARWSYMADAAHDAE